MSRKPCKYPRMPTGPSGFGEAGVRDLQKNGGYQRTRPSIDTLSIQSGDFSRVIISGVEYLITGVDEKTIRRDTKSYLQAFIPSVASGGGVNLGFGVYARGVSGFMSGTEEIFEGEYEYDIAPGLTSTADFLFFSYSQIIYLGGYYVRGVEAVTYNAYFNILPPASGSYYYRVNDNPVAYGQRPSKGVAGVSAAFTYAGRVDSAGRPLHDAILARFAVRANTESYLIDPALFTRPMAEFYPLDAVVVTKTHTCVLLAETFFRPEIVDPGQDYRPKVWLVTTPNTEAFGTLSYTDLTPSVFGGASIPAPAAYGSDSYYSANSGRNYNRDLSATLGTIRTAVVSDDTFIMSWQQRMPDGWRQRVAKITVAGGSATASLVYESADAGRPATPFWQSIVHLGQGQMLAKVASGWEGINFTITFRRSTDGGATWSDPFNPVGFDAPLLNQFFGNFTVDKPYKDGKHGVVLIPSWDQIAQAYFVYESKDSGASWKKRGRIYKPTTFRRIDTVLADDGGGNFDDILPGPDPSRAIDITLPTRYKDRV